MRISDKQVQQVVKAYADQIRRQGKAVSRPAEQQSHEIRLSPQSQDFRAALQALRALPEEDEARVRELKQQIDTGAYQVDSVQVAKKMLGRNLVDRLL